MLKAATSAILAISSPALAGAEGCDDSIQDAPADDRRTEFGEELAYQVERVVDGKEPQWDEFTWQYQDQNGLGINSGELDDARNGTLDAMTHDEYAPTERDRATMECWYAVVGAATKNAGVIQIGVNNWVNEEFLYGPGLEQYAAGNWESAETKCSWASTNLASGYYQDTGLHENTELMQLVRQTHPDGEGGFVYTTGLAEG